MIRKRLTILALAGMLLCEIIVPANWSKNVAAETNHVTTLPGDMIGIYSISDLQNIQGNLSGKYLLMANIDASAIANWQAIGGSTNPFTGTFDGNGYIISGLHTKVESSEPVYAGFFGYAKNAKIMNLTMENSDIRAKNSSFDANNSYAYAGGLVGFGYNVTITNCQTSGNVTADSVFNGFAGGFVGYLDSDYNKLSAILSSQNESTVTGKTNAGGFVGKAYRTTFKDVVNKGDLTKGESRYTGGIVGEMSLNSTIENATNDGNVTYTYDGGGIVGYASNGRITNSRNNGSVVGKTDSSDGGGIVGSGNSLFLQTSENHGNVTSVANGSELGGIAGSLMGQSAVLKSFNTADVRGPNGWSTYGNAGGIVGTNYSSIIAQTYNTALVTGKYAGGIVASSSNGSIEDSFNLGNLTGTTAGGILGKGTGGSIKQTYNLGRTNFYSSETGNLVGSYSSQLEHNYFYISSKEPFFTGTGVKQATFEEMKQSDTFEGFDFSTKWTISGTSRYRFPQLIGMPDPTNECSLVVSMRSFPTKTIYKKDESLDVTGASINVQTTFGNTQTIPVSSDMVSGFDGTKPGVQYLTVSYNGGTTFFEVTVKNRFTVTFTDEQGNVLKTESVDEGESATPPSPPEREGYTFSGWTGDTKTITSNSTFAAVYTMDEYTVTVVDDGNVIEQSKVGSQYTVELPNVREKEGYTLLGWFSDPFYKTRYEFFERIHEDTTIYAQFVKNPGLPKGFKVIGSSTFGVKLAWDKVDGADGYEVVSSTTPNGPFNMSSQPGDVNTLHANYYTPGKTIYFKIRALNHVGDQIVYGPFSEELSGKTVFQGVSNVKITSTSYDTATLTWTRSSSAGKYEGYEVLRSTSPNGTYKVVGTVYFGQPTKYTDKGIATGTTYYYKVRAVETMMSVSYSSPLSSPVSTTPVLPAVKSVKATATGYQSATVSWYDTPGATGFEIYRGSTSTGTFTLVKSYTNNNTKSFSDSKLTTGKPVYYKVRAVRVVNGKKVFGPYTTVSAVPTLAKPAKLMVLKASSTSSKVSWSKVSEASGYEIPRATSSKGKYTVIKTITSGSTLTYTNTRLSKGKTYYYKVRTYRMVNGKKLYSASTSIVMVKF
ncbi:InlB B-repeat-containing protein [Bacillus sp. sid0103]|uniref:InlB B-repeat-containing protein n=1 Tax=Bacillus sp. sid0103 TaxID=2856337 RepID=UPI001C478393|nr:InlB B-repeat-containing protein [Bacillus sp. sid0103]MBV7504827.1 InlB B-repeat-containing protein [Bacillus sp. sid0103]